MRTPCFVVVAAALASLAPSRAPAEPPAPAAPGWKMDMRAELALWQRAPRPIDAAHLQDALPLGVRLDLALLPTPKVNFLVAPRRAPKPGTFSALATVVVPTDGLYRVSAGSPVWLDLVDAAGANVKSSVFEMQAHSDLRKCVAFPLRAGVRYTLQVSGSAQPRASLLITPDARPRPAG